MRRIEFYLAFILIVWLIVTGTNLTKERIENITQQTTINCIDSLYHVDGIRFAVVRRNREMGKACMWCDQTLDGEGYDIIKSKKKGFVIDLRE